MQSSVYGSVVPVIFGCARSALYLIWAQNLRQHTSGKKLLFKKTQPTYAENVDFLIGCNPISGTLQWWQDNNVKYPLKFVKLTVSSIGGSYTISDANFYWLVAVTANETYNVTFNDFGSTGSRSLSGTYEVPMWNLAAQGPDPTRSTQMTRYPFMYYWAPGSGPTVFIANGALGETYDVNFYYAQLDPGGVQAFSKKNAGTDVPIAALNLTFENVLGNGPEYGAAYASQQILYPHYAGAGSPELDLGSGNMIPNIRPEVLGAFNLFPPRGDADFMDMVEFIFKSLPQGGYGSTENATLAQNGVSCFDFPGFVQSFVRNDLFSMNQGFFRLPSKAKNFLLVLYSNASVLTGCTFSDTAGNAYTTLFSGNDAGVSEGYAVAYAPASNQAPDNTVTASIGGTSCTIFLGEIAGVDTFDNAAHFATGSAPQITTTNLPNTRALLVAMLIGDINQVNLSSNFWTLHTPTSGAFITQQMAVYTRIVTQPGTYSFEVSGTYTVVLLAFKCANQANAGLAGTSVSLALGDALDRDSLNLSRQQCQAYGLWGSLVMDSQKKASDWLEDILTAANVAAVWSGFKLKLLPYAEASAAGNGAIYTSPTASGPVATITDDDFVAAVGQPPVDVSHKAQVNVPNIIQIEHPNRDNDYNNVILSQPENSTMALYGARKDGPKRLSCVYDPVVGRMILGILIRRQNYQRNEYSFTLNARHKLLEPMDLIYLNDQYLDLKNLPVRLTSVEEDDKYNLRCTAEDFLYGVNSPNALGVTTASPYVPQTGADPGSVNTPIIFEAVPRLTNGAQQLWLVVSGSTAAYAGCQAYISTDGGVSYNLLGQITGSAPTGVTTADWPAANDPDTVNDLLVNLTESLGVLDSYQVVDEDNFTYPCYVAGGTTDIPYELMTYALANLTSAFNYTLKATGGGTNKLRRAVFGAPQPLSGVDHPLGSRFAFLNPAGTGILKVNMDPSWIGKTLHFKFVAFNSMMGGQQSLASVTDYTFTPAGTVGSGSTAQNYLEYTISPAEPLSQPNSTTIDMAQFSANFATNSANYNARVFTIPDPGAGNTVVYYVTIFDPAYVGDTGSGTNLSAFCETSSAKVGKQGYTFAGSILAVHGGGGLATPGGIPVQDIVLINGT
jgi:hypothetical protein